MSTTEELEREIETTEKEITIVNQKRLEIVDKLQKLKSHVEELNAKLDLLKTSENSKVDWAANKYEWNESIHKILKENFQLKEFRHQQLSAINAVLSGKDVILLMPTGGGKSLCYQLPALVTKGITIVVSPLLSLIDDQIIALKKIGIDATALNSNTDKTENKRISEGLSKGNSTIKIIYVTPEWMAKSKRFMANLQKCFYRKGLDRIAIDEVHCCSQWGHDFRPDYKFLGVLKNVFPGIPLIGLTATATENIIVDVQNMLGIRGCIVLRASYNRPNLFYAVRQKPATQEKCLDVLEEYLTRTYKHQSGIIYTTTINDSEELAKELRNRGLAIACYHATMEPKIRQKVHTKWLNNQYQAVVATVAFGMGIDKPDVRFVIHHSVPKSMENFYQESGRAGRDDQRADCILFYSLKDVFRQSSMVSTSPKGSINLYKLMEYCLDVVKCRRSIIATHFNEVWDAAQCNKMCDNCQNSSAHEPVDITKHCISICSVISFANQTETRLTAIKLLEAWFKTGGSKLIRPPDVQKPMISREMAENIIAFMLVRKYLKEDLHFTAYNTISYISKGRTDISNKVVMSVRRCISTTGTNEAENKRNEKRLLDEPSQKKCKRLKKDSSDKNCK